MGKLGRNQERKAWTEFITGQKEPGDPRLSKFGNRRVFFNGKWYASQHEATIAAQLQQLAKRGLIHEYKEQVRIELVPGNGKLKPIIYIADFTYKDEAARLHVLDAKGFKTPVYRLKKRLAALLLGIEIEEV